MTTHDAVKKALGEWLAMTEAERIEAGLPTTQKEFAEKWGKSPRTIIRLKNDPLVQQEQVKVSRRLRGEPEEEDPDETLVDADQDPMLAEFERIRRKLVEDALKSNKGREAYFKYIGKDLLEQEKRAREKGFVHLSDDELVDEILGLIGRARVQAWMDASLAGRQASLASPASQEWLDA